MCRVQHFKEFTLINVSLGHENVDILSKKLASKIGVLSILRSFMSSELL